MKTAGILFAAALLCVALPSKAQEMKKYEFTVKKTLPVTPVKDQNETGTCWDFATTALLESEAIRINGITDPALYPDFSEIYTVWKSYEERLVKYIRTDGKISTGPGSLAPDLLHIVKDYGIVAQNAMPGLLEKPNHRALDKEVREFMKLIEGSDSLLRYSDWKNDFRAILRKHLGECPETFVVDGKEYTPAEYRDLYKINPDDYITIASFTHVPFYKEFITDVADNWRWDSAWNVPLEDLMRICYEAIEKGYTFAWDADMSEPTWLKCGIAYLPDADLPVTQESRQRAYDLKYTVDDHLMQIYGTAVDQAGHKFFVVKNSWGPETGDYGGDWFASEDYVACKTLQITLHRDAVPADILARLKK